MLDPQESPEEIKSREVELGSESWISFASVVPQQQCCRHCPCDCSAQQLRQQLRGTLVATQWRGSYCLNIINYCCAGGGPRPPWSSRSERAVEPLLFLSRPPSFPLSQSLISHLASVDVNKMFTYLLIRIPPSLLYDPSCISPFSFPSHGLLLNSCHNIVSRS